jgi:hypothetical protein
LGIYLPIGLCHGTFEPDNLNNTNNTFLSPYGLLGKYSTLEVDDTHGIEHKWPMATLIAEPCVVALPGGGTPFELLTFTGRTGSIFPKIPIDMCLPHAVCETCLHMPELG